MPNDVLLSAGDHESVGFSVGNENIEIVKNGSFWYIEGNEDFPLDQEIPYAMEKILSPLLYKRTVTQDCSDPETYGLGTLALKVSFTGSDQSGTLYIGDPCSSSPGWYFAFGDEKTVYLGDESLGNAFTFGNLLDLILLDNYPPLNANSVTGLKTDTFELVLTPEGAFGDTESRFSLKYGEKLFMTDCDTAEDTVMLISGIEPESCARYGITDEKVLREYGFEDKKLVVNYSDSGNELTSVIYIGSETDDGHVYTLLEGSNQICLVHDDYIKALSISAESLLSKKVFPLTPGKISVLEMKTESGVYSLERRTKSVEDAEGLTQTIVEYYKDGVLADQNNADALIDMLTSLKASSVAFYEPEGSEEVFVLIITSVDGQIHKISVIKDGEDFYALRDGVCWQKISEVDAVRLMDLSI
ncbi:MAG: DUF4340 domain-containing protein [Clostridia bacterium]|nr:DUF4340 domain-containing protein [Clostridia bacterium]